MTKSVDPTLIDPVTINILILADGRLRFDTDEGNDDFSLSLMIEGIHQTSGPVVRFSTTTAYRKAKEAIRKGFNVAFVDGVADPLSDSDGPGAEIGDFRFDCKSLGDKYDEVWIFGDQAEALNAQHEPEVTTTQLAPCELCALRQFMDEGGGVFATGDHLSLGAAINAHVPRVSVMRVWRNGPGTGGVGQVPSNDTVVVGQEFDTIPQIITPILFSGHPHPLLEGSRGPIDVLPDHVHEGICRDNWNASDLEEFPGHGSPMPVAIAASKRLSEQPPFSFPAIGAYDGHMGKIGRVVVDASFHHFVKFNLKQFLSKPGSPTTPPGTKTGVHEDIRKYHRNIAIWLARPERQREMFLRALWEVRWRSCASGVTAPALAITPADSEVPTNASAILRLGNAAKDALGRLISPSFILLWSIETFSPFIEDSVFAGLYPWLPENAMKPNPPPDPAAPPSKDAIAFMLGGVMMAMAARFSEKAEVGMSNLTEALQDVVREGVQIGCAAFKAR